MLPPTIPGSRPTVTAILSDAGVVTDDQIQAGLERQRETGRRIGECLVELGFVGEEDIAWALARQLGLSFVDVRGEALDLPLVKSFSESLLRRLAFVPIVRNDDRLIVAAADPTDHDAAVEIEQIACIQVNFVSATGSAIKHALDHVFGERLERKPRAVPEPGAHFDVVWDRSGEAFMAFHLTRALRAGATEIHFVQSGGALHVFDRIGTQIGHGLREPADTLDILNGRLESMGMPAAGETEGHDTCSGVVLVDGRSRSIHASRLVARDRTSITLRLLPDPDDRARLEQLGLDALDLARLRGMATEPAGLVIVCGPTGSGCSTTLAALLAELPTDEGRWLVFARDQRRWPPVSGLVDVITGAPVRNWQQVTLDHGADGLVLDGGLEGRRVRGILHSASHGRWVLAHTDWEDTSSLIEYLTRGPRGRALLSRRLYAVIQQRLIAAAPGRGQPGTRRGVFEVLFVTEALRTAIQQGVGASQIGALARADGFRSLAERVRAGIDAGELDPRDSERELG